MLKFLANLILLYQVTETKFIPREKLVHTH
jgi:hypothetical protein